MDYQVKNHQIITVILINYTMIYLLITIKIFVQHHVNNNIENTNRNIYYLADNTPVNVKMEFYLYKILDLDERNQVLHSNLWVRHSWNDLRLTWPSDLYDKYYLSTVYYNDIIFSISIVRLPMKKIWRPDTRLMNK